MRVEIENLIQQISTHPSLVSPTRLLAASLVSLLARGLFQNKAAGNAVFARALADEIQHVHKDCKDKHAVDTAIISFAQSPLYLGYFSS